MPASRFHDKDDTEYATMLWYDNYYDGPLSGLAEYKGETVWFQWLTDELEPFCELRTFGFYELSSAEVDAAEAAHNNDEPTPEVDYTTNRLIVELDETFINRGYTEERY